MKLKLSDIRLDGGTQSREKLDDEHIDRLAEKLRNGVDLPGPIVFYDGSTYWLADGFHRVAAAHACSVREILADVRQGTQDDAVLFSVGANDNHGLPRSNADKRRAVMTLLSSPRWSKWSNREIAKQCAVSLDLVNRTRAAASERNVQIDEPRKAIRNGREYTLNTANIGRPAKAPPVAAPDTPDEADYESEPDLVEDDEVDAPPAAPGWQPPLRGSLSETDEVFAAGDVADAFAKARAIVRAAVDRTPVAIREKAMRRAQNQALALVSEVIDALPWLRAADQQRVVLQVIQGGKSS